MSSVKSLAIRGIKTLLLPMLIFLVFTILSGGRFASVRMITTTLRQAVVPALICYSLMLNMTLGMVNFAQGAVVLTAGMLGGNLAMMAGLGIPGLVVFVLLIAVIAGGINGYLYVKIRVPAMVLTIGLMLVYEALPRVVMGKGINLKNNLTLLALSPWIFIVFGIAAAVFYVIYNKTAFGHNIQAVGSNQSIADSVGVNSDKVKFLSFLLGGFFLGLASILYTSTQGEVLPVTALGSMVIQMDALMGMFLALFISRYSNLTFAVPISALSMRMMANGFVTIGIAATVRDVTNGMMLLVLLAISMNQGIWERRKADKLFAKKAVEEYGNRVENNPV